MKKILILCAIAAGIFAGCYYDKTEELNVGAGIFDHCDTTRNVSYSTHLVPILQNYCYSCHAGPSPSSGVSLEDYNGLAAVASSGTLIDNITHAPGSNPMPPSFKLDSCRINLFRNWVANGFPNN
jgi:hypothetical protein